MIWRNIFLVIENFSFFHTVLREHSVEITGILSHQKKFHEINSSVTYLVKPLLSRNFCQKCVRENSRNFYTVVSAQFGKTRNSLSPKNISSNHLFSNLFSKTVIFTKFLRGSEVLFPSNPCAQCTVWKLREFCLTHFW